MEGAGQGRGSPVQKPSARDRTLRRLMRRPVIAGLVAEELACLGPGYAVADADGSLVAGDPAALLAEACDIDVGDRTVGRVHGPAADRLVRVLQALAGQEAETRALAHESLARYKEVTMLYDLSGKIIASPDALSVATLICEESMRFLSCDSVNVLLLNDETSRLEVAATRGIPFHSRVSVDIGDDIVAAVLRSGDGEIVNDVAKDSRGLAANNPLRSVICSPLKTTSGSIGAVVVGMAEARHFNAGDLQLLNAMAAQAATAIEVGRLDRDLKATSQKPADLIYGVDDRPPLAISAVLGLQHVFIAMMSLAYPVLVTLEAGASRLEAASVVSMSLVAMAVATVLQVNRVGPIGSGFLAPHITSAVYLAPSLVAARIGGLGLVFGMTILAGAVAMALSQLLRRFRKLFPPEVSGVVVLIVGVSMVPVAMRRFIGLGEEDTVTEPVELAVGVLTLSAIIALTVLPLGRVRLYSTLGGMLVGYGAAAAAGLIDTATFASVGDLPIVGLSSMPDVTPTFNAVLVLPFLAAALASVIKDAGLVISCQKSNNAAWKRPDTRSVSGGIVAGGIGNVASGLLGGVGVGISAGSIGLAAATGATSRVVGLVAAALFMVLAFMPQVTAAVALMPSPVMGAGLLYVACHLVTSGSGLIASRMLDARRTYIIGLSLLAGVGVVAMPDVFAAAPTWSQSFLGSPLAIATILAVGLNVVLSAGISSKARAAIAIDERIYDSVATFFERQGAAWGARGDVIRRAAPAVTEWCEEIAQAERVSCASVELQFDEYRLTAAVRATQREATAAAESSASLTLDRIAGHLARRYDCKVRSLDGTDVVFDFEH